MAWITGNRKVGFRVQWRTGGRGSDYDSSDTFALKADALQWLSDWKETKAAEKRLCKSALLSTPIEDLLVRWSRSRVADRAADPAYLANASKNIRSMAATMQWNTCRDITPEDLDTWKSNRTAGKVGPMRHLKSFLGYCRNALRLPISEYVFLTANGKPASKRKPPDLLTEEQVGLILSVAIQYGGWQVAAALEHVALYACRPIDVSTLLISDWDPARSVITYRDTKNGSDVSHTVHDFHAAKLTQAAGERDPAQPLFLDPWNRPWRVRGQSADGMSSWYYANVGRHLCGLGKLATNQRGIYCLKDFGMTRASAAAGGNRRAVIALSGHTSETVVDRYISTNADLQRTVLAGITEVAVQPLQIADPKFRRNKAVSTGVSTEGKVSKRRKEIVAKPTVKTAISEGQK